MIVSDVLIFFVNGRKVVVTSPDPEMTLLHYLRYKLYLTGTKQACGEGGCGACTVMVSRFDPDTDVINAINACLAPLCTMHGASVTTVEGLGSVQTRLHPIQRQLAESHGSQCGFCTPGFIMSMYALLRNHPQPSKQQLYEALDGNLCRCTGYRPILEGLHPFTDTVDQCMGENCCRKSTYGGDNSIMSCGRDEEDGHTNTQPQLLYDPSQEPIFPPELKLMSHKLNSEILKFSSNRCIWYRPVSLDQLLEIKEAHPDCKIVSGNSEIGIEAKFQQKHFCVLVSSAFVPELKDVAVTGEGIRFGSAVTLSDVERHLKLAIKTIPEDKTRIFAAFAEMLRWFAGTQIRNVASLGGNLINSSPISDLNPLLLACNAALEFAAPKSYPRRDKIDANFFTSYKKIRMRPEEVLVAITIPFSSENEYFFGYKQANRREDDIAIVNAGMWVELTETGTHVKNIRLAFGGMSSVTKMATNTMNALIGKKWDSNLLECACSSDLLPADLPLASGSPGGMVAFRRTLTLSFFFRFYVSVLQRIEQKSILTSKTPSYQVDRSAIDLLTRGPSQGCQLYSLPSESQTETDTIGRPVVHRAAYKQCTGEAIFMDDVPAAHGELFLGLVTSKKAHARLISVDLSPALTMPGVVDVIDHRDVPNLNEWEEMEKVFASDTVTHEGQVIAAVLAETLAEAQRAAQKVKVVYEDLEPIVSIKDAIDRQSFYPTDLKIDSGEVESAFSKCEHIATGELNVSGQEHFYLEPHGCIVYPRDAGEFEVIATSQSPTQMQKALRRVLGLPANQIVVKVKRLGGGFGGKETRNVGVLLPAAVGAYKTKRPVRGLLDRDEDMCLTGTRHPAYITYKIGFNSDAEIVAIDADLYLNMGHTLDLSAAVLETAMLAIDSAYNIKNFRVKGHLCITNLTSCTAFRGFGGPQAIIMAEHWITHVADILVVPQEVVRERNFYKDGDKIPCGQVVSPCNVGRCWDECIKNSDFYQRLDQVKEFNRASRWKKRGIAVTPLKYGLAFLLQSMNQGGALVHIYTDGTVLVTHGGVEMGQGLHTKMIQVVSRELGIPVSSVHISETSTGTVPNTGPTAASMSSDLYGAAVMDACKTLKEKLEPYRSAQPNVTLKEWAHAAHQDRICLTATGFYKLEEVSLDWSKSVNSPFSYFSFGAACSEVEIDCLTGDHQVLRTDIVMDVGQTLNPAIDVGQIEGAFMQGYGLMMLEKYSVSPSGYHLSRGPGTYKIPSLGNIPQIMNVALLKDSKNPRAIYSSKGVGEPPLCLATSVLMATKKAIKAAREHSGHCGFFQLDTPATPDRIRMACLDQFSTQFLEDEKLDKQHPWYVTL